MTINIRPMQEADLPPAAAILRSGFQRGENWIGALHQYRVNQPDGCFLALQEGQAAGMVGAVIYPDYAYVGMMAVHQDWQRRGVGMALMEHLLAWLENRNVQKVVLDASPYGQPLYERLGFEAYDAVDIYEGNVHQPVGNSFARVEALTPGTLESLAGLDGEAFGTDRLRVLNVLLQVHLGGGFLQRDGKGTVDGYILTQENRIGPWVMKSFEGSETMLKSALAQIGSKVVSLAVPGENTPCRELLEKYGFTKVRVNRHMVRGDGGLPGKREYVFAQASLSKG